MQQRKRTTSMIFNSLLLITACHFIRSIETLPLHASQLHTVTEIVRRNPSLTKLQSLLRKTELGFKLDQSRDLTFLAPDNTAVESAAFDQIGGNYLSYDDTLQILSNHVIPKVVKIEELAEGIYEFETLAGSTLRFTVMKETAEAKPGQPSSASVSVNKVFSPTGPTGPVSVTVLSDKLHDEVEAVNGLVYSISTLLIPERLESVVGDARKELEIANLLVATAPDNHFNAPDHVQETNRVHWNEKDAMATPTPETNEGPKERSGLGSNTLSDSPQQSDVGVLQYNDDHKDLSMDKRIEGLIVVKTDENDD